MATVFIPQLPMRFDHATNQRIPSIDVNPAASYGTLDAITIGVIPREEAIEKVHEGIARMTEDDFILAIGDVVLLAIAMADALQLNGSVNLLRWDNDKRIYRTEVITKWQRKR